MASYHEIFEKMPDGITLHDPADGAILDTNQQFCDMLGYSREELLDLDFQAIHVDEPPYTSERAAEYVQKAATEGPQTFEWMDETKDGEPLPVEVNLRQTTIDGNNRILAVVRDITERKERERQIQRESERFRSLFESTNDAIAWVEYDGETPYIREANSRFKELFEPAGSDVAGSPLDEVVASDERRSEAAEISRRVQDGTRLSAELRRDTVDGPRAFLWEAVPLEDPATGEVNRTFAVYTDVSELRERERELERKNERLNEFANVISHDLRNPLNVAQGRLELAREECDSDHLDSINRALGRIDELIEDVLALARAGESIGETEEIDLAKLVEACWQNVHTAEASLETNAELVLNADGTRLRQLLENLFRNAIEHSAEDVTVRIGEVPNGFYVEDDGPGIPQEEQEAIFEAGYSTAEDGTGFGLNIVRDIAEAHDWNLRLTESSAGGARFEFTGVDILR